MSHGPASADPVTIVTGGGTGIGRAVCELLAATGRRLVIVGRTPKTLDETIGLCRSFAGPMCAVVADLAEPASAARVVAHALDRYGRVDEIVNNAGVAPLARIEEAEPLLGPTFEINTFGPARLIAQAWPHLVTGEGGCIVNVSSMATIDPFPGFLVYASTKAALESMTRSCANEGRDHGITAYSVAPGAVETDMLRKAFPEFPAEQTLDPRAVAQVVADCVLGRREEPSGATIPISA